MDIAGSTALVIRAADHPSTLVTRPHPAGTASRP